MNYSVKISNFIAKDLDQIKDKNSNITVLTDEKGFYFEEDGKVRLVKATPLPGNVKEKESAKTVSAKLKQELKNTVTPTKVEENEAIQEDQVQYENTLKTSKLENNNSITHGVQVSVWQHY